MTITATLWKDGKGIMFLCNFHDATNFGTVARKNIDGTSKGISCPEIMKHYSADMVFVDKTDMLIPLRNLQRESKVVVADLLAFP